MTLSERFFSDRPLIFGRAPAAGTALTNVSELGQAVDLGAVFNVAYALDVISSAAADAAAGTGARTVNIAGLDLAGNPLAETVTLNGQTAVTTSKLFWRVFGAQCMTFGSGRKNAGDIYIYKTGTGGTITGGVPGTLTSAVIKILVGENLGSSGFFTAPLGNTYRITSWLAGTRVQVGKFMIWKAAERIVPAMPPYMALGMDRPVGVPAQIKEAAGMPLYPLEDIYVRTNMGAAGGVPSFTLTLEKA